MRWHAEKKQKTKAISVRNKNAVTLTLGDCDSLEERVFEIVKFLHAKLEIHNPQSTAQRTNSLAKSLVLGWSPDSGLPKLPAIYWCIDDIDATWKKLDQPFKDWQAKFFGLMPKDFENWINPNKNLEQIIDLDATLMENDKKLVRILVMDGTSVDVLTSEIFIPEEVLGPSVNADPENFYW